MHALLYRVSIPKVVLSRTLGNWLDTFRHGTLSGLSLVELPRPGLPGPDWVRLEVLAGGVCGTDLLFLRFHGSISNEPYSSFPAVLGHEVVARIAELGSGVRGFEVGQRVAVDPTISCRVRGYAEQELCPACAAGRANTCARAGQSGRIEVGGQALAPGTIVGFHSQLPGGWGEEMLAHVSQLYPVDDTIDDHRAVLTEPLAVAVHAVVNSLPQPGALVLVIGSGPIALSCIWALRALGFEGGIVAQMKRSRESELARALGASEVLRPGPEARDRLLASGAVAHQPTLGPEVFRGGGFDLVYDCVGSRQSLDQALRFAAPQGSVVLLGCAGELKNIDFYFVWARELKLCGYYTYGLEQWQGERLHTFELTLRLLRQSPAPIEKMVTREVPISRYQEALAAASHRERSGDLKVILRPGA